MVNNNIMRNKQKIISNTDETFSTQELCDVIQKLDQLKSSIPSSDDMAPDSCDEEVANINNELQIGAFLDINVRMVAAPQRIKKAKKAHKPQKPQKLKIAPASIRTDRALKLTNRTNTNGTNKTNKTNRTNKTAISNGSIFSRASRLTHLTKLSRKESIKRRKHKKPRARAAKGTSSLKGSVTAKNRLKFRKYE